MNPPPGEDGQLASLLRAIPAPEPPPDFVAGARRRYRDAIEARYRRKIFMSLAGALLGWLPDGDEKRRTPGRRGVETATG